MSLKHRVEALHSLPLLFHLLWVTSPRMTVANVLLRLVRAAVPLALLSLGKLIVNEIVRLRQVGGEPELSHLWALVAAECGIALLADLLRRGIALLDSLLGDRFSIHTSLRVMEHAAGLDLERFEDSTFYDKFERARQQTSGRILLMSQALSQIQDSVTLGLLAVGLVAFSPWLLLLLLVTLMPAFLGEAHFNGQTYSFMYQWTPERRELEYLRYTGASDDTTGIVNAYDMFTGVTKDGKVQTLHGRTTLVFVRHGGQWKIVSAHFSPLPHP